MQNTLLCLQQTQLIMAQEDVCIAVGMETHRQFDVVTMRKPIMRSGDGGIRREERSPRGVLRSFPLCRSEVENRVARLDRDHLLSAAVDYDLDVASLSLCKQNKTVERPATHWVEGAGASPRPTDTK